MRKEYLKIKKVIGPLIVLENIEGVSYGEVIKIRLNNNKQRIGKVIRVDSDKVIAQVFEGTSGLSTDNASIKFTGNPFKIDLSLEMLGRSFNGVGATIDNGGPIFGIKSDNINGKPINPIARRYPKDYIRTGISAIDTLSTLIRGQKLPIFSGSGLPHNELAAQIIRQAKVLDRDDKKFAIVFGAIGIKSDDAAFFKNSFEEAGVLEKVVMFINLANDPIVERVSTPRCALTTAEYLAFENDYDVLVILTDMTSYCEALREISSARDEVPSRKGYPGYLYSDLANIYERAGVIKGKSGSITLLPILTMPNDDITHPIPDLTGYITEGQIVLSKDLHRNNIYPPIDILPSLSRLMKDCIGSEFTREDHPDVANQLFASYSRVKEVQALAQIIGESDLSSTDQKILEFGRKFEYEFIAQNLNKERSIEKSLKIAWRAIRMLPIEELDRIDEDILKKYFEE